MFGQYVLLVYVSPCHFNDYLSLKFNLQKASVFKKVQTSDKNSWEKRIKIKDINIKYKQFMIKVVGVILIDTYDKSQIDDLDGKI